MQPSNISGSGGARQSLTPAAARVLPFAVFVLFLGATSAAALAVPAEVTWDARVLYTARTVAVALILAALWNRYGELASTRIRRADLVAAAATGAAVFALWLAIDWPWASVGNPAGFDPSRSDGRGIDWALALPRLLGFAVVTPVMEELFWRSFLARWLDDAQFLRVDPRALSARSLGLTALVFGLAHHHWIAGILSGLAYGWLYHRSGSLWVPVAAHALTNALLGTWILCTASWQYW